MDKKILEQPVDEQVGKFLVQKIEEYKAQIDEDAAKKIQVIKESFDAKSHKLFAYVDTLIENAEKDATAEFSARLATKLEEKNQTIAEMQETMVAHKEQLTEKVNEFLANSKDELRGIIAEEMRIDSAELTAQTTLNKVRDAIGAVAPVVKSVDESKTVRLESDVNALNKRVEDDRKVKEYLRAKVKMFEMAETVPSEDREFFLSQLKGVETVKDVETKFHKIEEAVKASRSKKLEEELVEDNSKGVSESAVEPEDKIVLDESKGEKSMISRRMEHLAFS